MNLAWPVRFHQEDGEYWTQGLEPMSGVLSQGGTLEEARFNAREALTGVLMVMLDHGETIPRPLVTDEPGVEMIAPDPVISAPILLRWAREDAKITQAELASRLGVTYQAVQRLERSGANPSIKTLAKVARALGRELEIAI